MTRQSKRELERAIEELKAGVVSTAGLMIVLSAESIDAVDPDRCLYRIDGEVMEVYEALAGLASAGAEATA